MNSFIPPTPPGGDAVTLDSLLPPAQRLWAVVLGVLGIALPASAAYFGATARTEKALEVAQSAVVTSQAATAGVAQLRADTERAAKEQQTATESRFRAMEAQRQADEEARRKDREELIRIGLMLGYLQKDSQDTRSDIRVLLDRLNATPRARTARDFPQ